MGKTELNISWKFETSQEEGQNNLVGTDYLSKTMANGKATILYPELGKRNRKMFDLYTDEEFDDVLEHCLSNLWGELFSSISDLFFKLGKKEVLTLLNQLAKGKNIGTLKDYTIEDFRVKEVEYADLSLKGQGRYKIAKETTKVYILAEEEEKEAEHFRVPADEDEQ